MKSYKKLLIITFVALFCQNIFAQTRNGIYGKTFSQSIMVSAGANYYFGDIEKSGIFSKDWGNQVSGFGQIAYVRNVYKETLRLRVNVLGGMLNGEKNVSSFKNTFFEPDAILEYFPFTITKDKLCNCLKRTLGFYIYGGAGLALYSVKLNVADKEIKYNSYVPMAALGGGYRFTIASRFELGIELGYRMALVDKLNVSLDGYPYRRDADYISGEDSSKWNDGFYTIGITAGYRF